MDVNAVLRRRFGLADDSSIECSSDEMTGQTGFLSYRRHVRIRRPVGDGDAKAEEDLRLFVKHSDSSRTDLGVYTQLSVSYCQRECVFYGYLAPILLRAAEQYDLEPVLPKVYMEVSNSVGSMLVMEDLSEQGFELAPELMSAGQLRTTLRALATAQATFLLARHKLGPHALATSLLGSESALADLTIGSPVTVEDLLAEAYDTFMAKFADFVDDGRREATLRAYFGADYLPKGVRAVSCISDNTDALGVVHFDLWFNNCMLRDTDGACRLLDWQFFSIGGIAYDMGILWVSSADNSLGVQQFLSCVDYFYETLRDIFESKTGAELPFSLEKVRAMAVNSLHTAAAWVLLSADSLLEIRPATFSNMLANLADAICQFQL